MKAQCLLFVRLAGKPVSARFDGLHDDKCFIMRFEEDPLASKMLTWRGIIIMSIVSGTTTSEIFVPLGVHYPRGVDIEVKRFARRSEAEVFKKY